MNQEKGLVFVSNTGRLYASGILGDKNSHPTYYIVFYNNSKQEYFPFTSCSFSEIDELLDIIPTITINDFFSSQNHLIINIRNEWKKNYENGWNNDTFNTYTYESFVENIKRKYTHFAISESSRFFIE